MFDKLAKVIRSKVAKIQHQTLWA